MKVRVEFRNSIQDCDCDIAEAFGLGDEFNNVIEAEVPDGLQTILITGESGCGKSVIARQIGITEVEIDGDIPIADELGISHEESLRWLTAFGLGDAKIFTLPYSALSDSQQARYRAMVATYNTPQGEYVVIDEFLSTLDRSTARFVALSIKRAVERSGRKLVAVTAMSDIAPWLMPDATVRGWAFPSRFKTFQVNWGDPLRDLTFKYGTKEDYRDCKLGDLHYRGKYTGGTKEYLFAEFEGEKIGVLVSTNRINDGGRRIARLVVHPKARGCGIGSMLVRKYLSRFPDTDVIASMARFSKVFEAAGMVEAKPSVVNPPSGLKSKLQESGFDVSRWHSLQYCREFAENEEHRKMLSGYSKSCTKLVQPGGRNISPDEIAKRITESPETAGRVLYWLRPRQYAKYVSKKEKSC